jgi:hypothetical protein
MTDVEVGVLSCGRDPKLPDWLSPHVDKSYFDMAIGAVSLAPGMKVLY